MSGFKSWIMRWLTTTNHKDIGILYMVTAMYFFFVAGTLALIFRVQLAMPDSQILGAKAFNQAVSVHGLIMLLWFLSPIQFGLANYFVPLQIGARDLAFPRLNALSYWLFLFSGLLLIVSFFVPGGAVDGGWTLYAPLNTAYYSPSKGFDLAVLAIVMLSTAVTLGTINFMVTIIKMRAPGMTWDKVPMFTWSILFTILLMLLAFPALAAAGILLLVDRLLGTTFFLSPEGGALLWDHLFWFFGHPEVYILLFPSLGALADIISSFTGRPLYAKKFVLVAFMAATVLSYIVWVHHMFITGTSLLVRKIFSVTTALISIPFEMATLALILTLYKGRIRYTGPMLFAIASIPLFIIGGATGVFNAAIILDRAFRGTYWVVAHFHYIMAGTALFAVIAALYYWFPKMTGRMVSEKLIKIQLILAVVGINVLYFPQFILIDMPRRIYTYSYAPEWLTLNQISTIGAFIFAASFIVALVALIHGLTRGRPAGDNPWGAWGLEWLTRSPPPPHNFDGQPIVTQDGRVLLVDEATIREKGLDNIISGKATVSVTGTIMPNGTAGHQAPAKAHHSHVHHHGSIAPLGIAVGMFLAFLAMPLSKPSWLLAGAILVFASLAKWIYDEYKGRFTEPEPPYREEFPLDGIDKFKAGLWTFIAGEGFLFGSLIGAYIFIRTRSPAWTPGIELHDVGIGLFNTVVLFTAALAMGLAYYNAKAGNVGLQRASLAFALGLGLLFLATKAYEWSKFAAEGYGLTSTMEAQLYYVLTGAHAAHVLVGVIASLYALLRSLKKPYGPVDASTLLYIGVYWGIVDIVWTFIFPMFYLI